MNTGATHHLTGKYNIMPDVRQMAPILVVLDDGRQRVLKIEGKIRLGSYLVLKSVFYVEKFQSDLIL